MAANTDSTISDPLLALRRALSSSPTSPVLTTSSEPNDSSQTTDLVKATHLFLPDPPQSIPLSTPTRFVSAAANQTIDLRSIYFAWLKRDVAIPEYIASAQELNDALAKKSGGAGEEGAKVLNLVFVERLDLITWLEGASEESEYIRPLPTGAAGAGTGDSAGSAAGAKGAVGAVPGARPVKVIDPRLQKIYNGERKMGDRNSVLRGIKPTVSCRTRSLGYALVTWC